MTTRLVPIEDLARTLTVSVTTVRSWVRTGLIPGDRYVKIGNTYRFDKEAIIDHFKPQKSVIEVTPSSPLPPPPKVELDPEMEQLVLDFFAEDNVDVNL
jgi:excisionase family DNA binding protein